MECLKNQLDKSLAKDSKSRSSDFQRAVSVGKCCIILDCLKISTLISEKF